MARPLRADDNSDSATRSNRGVHKSIFKCTTQTLYQLGSSNSRMGDLHHSCTDKQLCDAVMSKDQDLWSLGGPARG